MLEKQFKKNKNQVCQNTAKSKLEARCKNFVKVELMYVSNRYYSVFIFSSRNCEFHFSVITTLGLPMHFKIK